MLCQSIYLNIYTFLTCSPVIRYETIFVVINVCVCVYLNIFLIYIYIYLCYTCSHKTCLYSPAFTKVCGDPCCSQGGSGKLSRGKFLQSTAATQRFKSKTGNQKGAKNHGKFSHSRCFVGTSSFDKGLLWKISCGQIFAKHSRHAAFQKQDGEPKKSKKSWSVFSFALFRPNLSFEGLALENFLARHFVQSTGPTQHFKRKTPNQKRPKIMGSFLIRAVSSSLVVRRACLEKFLPGKFLQITGATQRFRRKTVNQKRAKIMGSFLIRAVSSELVVQRACLETFLA